MPFIAPYLLLIPEVRVLKESLVCAERFIEIRLARRLIGRVHVEDSHAAVDDIHAVEGENVGDRPAAADVDLAELRRLRAHGSVVEYTS